MDFSRFAQKVLFHCPPNSCFSFIIASFAHYGSHFAQQGLVSDTAFYGLSGGIFGGCVGAVKVSPCMPSSSPHSAPRLLFSSLLATGCMGWCAACSRPVEPGHCRSRTLRRQQRRDLRCHCRHVQGCLHNYRGRARQICASCAVCCPHVLFLLVVHPP